MISTQQEGCFVRHLEIVRVLPCLADPSKIRFTSLFDADVSELFPYVNTVLHGAIYNHRGKTLTLKKEGRLITLYPRRVEAAKILNLEDAHHLIGWVVDLLNDIDRRRLDLNPDFSRRARLTVLDIVKLLPGTHCKKCGYATCLAFAAALSDEAVSIMICADLFLTEFVDKKKELLSLLAASGYPVPDVFGTPDSV